LAKKIDLIDYPRQDTHHNHSKPTPKAGGISFLLSISIIFIFYKFWQQTDLLHILIPTIIIFSFGLWDDKFGMNAPIKLFGQIIAVTILVLFDVRVQFLENQKFFIQFGQTTAYWVDMFITYFWMIGITNAFNMVDSMDGLAIGLSRVTSAFFFLISIISEQPSLVYLSAIIFGISWGIAFFNEQPAKTFLGDSGAQSLGFLLAAIAIMYHPKADSQQSTWFIPIMFFTVPIFDTTLVTISRLRNRLPFYKANLDHTYHRLVKLGWDPYRAVAITQISAVVASLTAICASYLPSLAANMIFVLWILVFATLIFFLEKTFTTQSSN
jgi:UDP-GlcNAc:undecaprenyl-phosphate GlcNAc-1-phosphate transferase